MPTKEMRAPEPLDAIDRKLVALLRADARTPNSRLAEQAGIAPSTCVTRVRGLVERGVITGFTATIDADAVGVGLQALISIAIRAGARHGWPRSRTRCASSPTWCSSSSSADPRTSSSTSPSVTATTSATSSSSTSRRTRPWRRPARAWCSTTTTRGRRWGSGELAV